MRDPKPSSDDQQSQSEDDKNIDQMIARAVEAVAKGENVEQLLEYMLATMPAHTKEKIRKKFTAALAKRHLRQPLGEADIPSRGTLLRLRNIFAITAKQALDRIAAVVRARPDIASGIDQAGQILTRNGVALDRTPITEADLGTLAPPAVGVGQAQERKTGRGV